MVHLSSIPLPQVLAYYGLGNHRHLSVYSEKAVKSRVEGDGHNIGPSFIAEELCCMI